MTTEAALTALVAKWRDDCADVMSEKRLKRVAAFMTYAAAMNSCADELEAALSQSANNFTPEAIEALGPVKPRYEGIKRHCARCGTENHLHGLVAFTDVIPNHNFVEPMKAAQPVGEPRCDVAQEACKKSSQIEGCLSHCHNVGYECAPGQFPAAVEGKQ